MKVHILDDYDYDCELREVGDYCDPNAKVYEIPDELVKEYEEVNNHREELKEKILLIERQCRLADLANPANGIKPKGFD